MKRFALVVAIALAGCTSASERRRLVIHEAKIVLRHSSTEASWAERRAQLEAEIQLEDPDLEAGK